MFLARSLSLSITHGRFLHQGDLTHRPCRTPDHKSAVRKRALGVILKTMESARNGSVFRGQLSLLYNNSSTFCQNLSDAGNSSTLAETRCDAERGLEDDANPVIIAIIITALYSIVCVVGLVGNVLVMYIIVR